MKIYFISNNYNLKQNHNYVNSVSTEKRPQNYKQVGHYGVQIKVNLIKDVTSDPAARNKRFTQFTQFYRGQLSKTTYQIFKV